MVLIFELAREIEDRPVTAWTTDFLMMRSDQLNPYLALNLTSLVSEACTGWKLCSCSNKGSNGFVAGNQGLHSVSNPKKEVA